MVGAWEENVEGGGSSDDVAFCGWRRASSSRKLSGSTNGFPTAIFAAPEKFPEEIFLLTALVFASSVEEVCGLRVRGGGLLGHEKKASTSVGFRGSVSRRCAAEMKLSMREGQRCGTLGGGGGGGADDVSGGAVCRKWEGMGSGLTLRKRQ